MTSVFLDQPGKERWSVIVSSPFEMRIVQRHRLVRTGDEDAAEVEEIDSVANLVPPILNIVPTHFQRCSMYTGGQR